LDSRGIEVLYFKRFRALFTRYCCIIGV
jgi:hypothetical protein